MKFIISKQDSEYVLTVPGFKEYKLFDESLASIEKEIIRISRKHKAKADVIRDYE